MNLLWENLEKHLNLSLFNRIDEVIVFNSLSKNVVYDILDKIVKETEARLSDKKIRLILTDKAKDYIIDNSYDENYGARPIKRYVSRNLESMLAKAIILDEIKYDSEVIIDVKDNELIIKADK